MSNDQCSMFNVQRCEMRDAGCGAKVAEFWTEDPPTLRSSHGEAGEDDDDRHSSLNHAKRRFESADKVTTRLVYVYKLQVGLQVQIMAIYGARARGAGAKTPCSAGFSRSLLLSELQFHGFSVGSD